jgi:hypothetical protein
MDTMADDENPAWFREEARSAGKDVERALKKCPNPYSQTAFHSAFEHDSLKLEPPVDEVNSLEKCKKSFESQVSIANTSGYENISLNRSRRYSSCDIPTAIISVGTKLPSLRQNPAQGILRNVRNQPLEGRRT